MGVREIIFRGKRKDNGEWVYGAYYKQEHVYGYEKIVHCIITSKDVLSNDLGLDYEGVIPETVGQYIGLTDKNGEKIFEGDIVIADFDYKKEPMEVIYYKCGFKLKSKHCKEVYDYSIHDETPEIKVIGNIHDNPELLKGED